MILFIGTLIALLTLAAIAIVVTLVAGGAFVFVFADVIMFFAIVWFLIKLFKKEKSS